MSELYTVISATNRANSNTLKVAKQYEQLLRDREVNVRLMSLEGWKWLHRDPEFTKIESDILAPATKFVFVVGKTKFCGFSDCKQLYRYPLIINFNLYKWRE